MMNFVRMHYWTLGLAIVFSIRSLMTKLNLKCPKMSYQLNTLHDSGSQRTEVATLKMSSRDGKEIMRMKNVLVT